VKWARNELACKFVVKACLSESVQETGLDQVKLAPNRFSSIDLGHVQNKLGPTNINQYIHGHCFLKYIVFVGHKDIGLNNHEK
jgi:hypothetical protein